MTEMNPDPDPRETTGVEPGGGVPPGETPPGESSTSSATGPPESYKPGWSRGPLIAIVLVACAVAGFFITYAVSLGR